MDDNVEKDDNIIRNLTESEADIYDKMLNSEAVETGIKLY